MIRLRVVLVEPQIPANLGFLARALDNFGIEDWWAVRGCRIEGTEAERTGAPSRERLLAMQRAETLDQALAEGTHIIGLTARQGYHRRPVPLPELPALWREFGPAARPVLLFGREDRGLEEEECARCTHLVTIPTHGLASLNLSHAVAVTLYALSAEGLLGQASVAEPERGHEPWAPLEDRQRLAADLLAFADEVGVPVDTRDLEPALRRVSAQAIETRDLRLLWRILRHMRWLEEQKSSD